MSSHNNLKLFKCLYAKIKDSENESNKEVFFNLNNFPSIKYSLLVSPLRIMMSDDIALLFCWYTLFQKPTSDPKSVPTPKIRRDFIFERNGKISIDFFCLFIYFIFLFLAENISKANSKKVKEIS